MHLFSWGQARQTAVQHGYHVVLRRMKRDDIPCMAFAPPSVIGRPNRTNYPNEVVEMAPAHAVSDKVEAAYRRGDLFEKRRRLMADWATFCSTPKAAKRSGSVVPLRGNVVMITGDCVLSA